SRLSAWVEETLSLWRLSANPEFSIRLLSGARLTRGAFDRAVEGKRYRKRSTPSTRRSHFDIASVFAQNSLADTEPQARAPTRSLGRVKRIEDVRQVFRR